jgi:hypothetical protein
MTVRPDATAAQIGLLILLVILALLVMSIFFSLFDTFSEPPGGEGGIVNLTTSTALLDNGSPEVPMAVVAIGVWVAVIVGTYFFVSNVLRRWKG